MTDIIMPDKDGLEVIMALKRVAPTIKIIAVSGEGRIDATSYLDLAVKLGASASLSKPFSGETLISTVNRVLSA
jgi:YesN/AraC family two-component response regulator